MESLKPSQIHRVGAHWSQRDSTEAAMASNGNYNFWCILTRMFISVSNEDIKYLLFTIKRLV